MNTSWPQVELWESTVLTVGIWIEQCVEQERKGVCYCFWYKYTAPRQMFYFRNGLVITWCSKSILWRTWLASPYQLGKQSKYQVSYIPIVCSLSILRYKNIARLQKTQTRVRLCRWCWIIQHYLRRIHWSLEDHAESCIRMVRLSGLACQ